MNKHELIYNLITKHGFTKRKAQGDARAQMQGWATVGYWLEVDRLRQSSDDGKLDARTR